MAAVAAGSDRVDDSSMESSLVIDGLSDFVHATAIWAHPPRAISVACRNVTHSPSFLMVPLRFVVTGSVVSTPPRRDASTAGIVNLLRTRCSSDYFPTAARPTLLEALPPAIERGLRLPLVYNTSAYDSLDSLELMDGVIDIYMPDFKFWDLEM